MKPTILLYLVVVFATSEGNIRDYDIPGCANMVDGHLNASEHYEMPKDNRKLTQLKDKRIYDYGHFDFIIVGGGSAGTLLTRRLSEIANWTILLLEAGDVENDFSSIPAMAPYLTRTDMNWGYLGEPQTTCCLGMKNQQCIAPRGKVLGGSSAINGKMYVRGNPRDFDLWSEMGNDGWSYKEVLPYFKKTENFLSGHDDPGYHGVGGLLSVTQLESNIFSSAYLDGMNELGYKMIDYNGENSFGYSQTYSNIDNAGISSGGRAFINNILDRTNLNLTLQAYVTKININKKNVAEGVEFIKNGKKFRAFANKEVILSGGAFNSPQLLMLSGIGPKEELSRLNISIIKDLPVGKYMQDHPMFLGIMGKTNLTDQIQTTADKCKLYFENHRPFTCSSGLDSTAFFKINNSTSVPEIQQIYMVPPTFGTDPAKILNYNEEVTRSYQQNFNMYGNFIIITVLLHAKSRGSVTLKSKDPSQFPSIDYKYFSDPHNEDIETLYQGVQKTLKLFNTEAFKSVNATLAPYVPACEKYKSSSREYWYCMIRAVTSTIYHPVGTTRMGPSESNSVVDSKLIVHGFRNLRVVDAGVMPEITSGNTNAPTYMIAEKAADIIKKRHWFK